VTDVQFAAPGLPPRGFNRNAARQVYEFMERHRLTVADLTEYGGEDLRIPRRKAKARQVERCWELMASLGVKHADLA
jgi:hypothetical protein